MGTKAGHVARDAPGARWRKGLTVNVNMVNLNEIFKDHFGGEVGMQMPERV